MADFTLPNLFNVKGLVAVITGGGTGIGAMMAKALDANGAKAVYVVGRRKEPLEKVAGECANGSVRPVVGDVTSKESLEAVATQVEKEVGYIDVLCANAGISGLGLGPRPDDEAVKTVAGLKAKLWAAPMADFTHTMHANVTSSMYTALAFLELLDAGNRRHEAELAEKLSAASSSKSAAAAAAAAAGGGGGGGGGEKSAATVASSFLPTTPKANILITTSAGAFSRVPAMGLDYSLSKAAQAHLVKMLATALAPFRVRVNGLAPGFFPSEIVAANPTFQDLAKDPRVEGNMDYGFMPLGRMGHEFDMAGAVLFLLSPAGAYMSGNILLLDGGRLSIMPAAY